MQYRFMIIITAKPFDWFFADGFSFIRFIERAFVFTGFMRYRVRDNKALRAGSAQLKHSIL